MCVTADIRQCTHVVYTHAMKGLFILDVSVHTHCAAAAAAADCRCGGAACVWCGAWRYCWGCRAPSSRHGCAAVIAVTTTVPGVAALHHSPACWNQQPCQH